MSEPLDNRKLKHYLTFVTDGLDPIEIDEPVGFDAANFSIKQRDDGYARDITFSGDGEAEYEFYEKCNPLGHQIERLIDGRKRKGFEYICTYSLYDTELDVNYVVGNVDFETSQTNFYDYFKAIIVQDTKNAIIQRKESTKIDLFSDEGIDRNEIEPVFTHNLLLKPVPEIQNSEWKISATKTFFHPFLAGGGGTVYYNDQNVLLKSGIKNSLSYLTFYTSFEQNIDNVSYIEAQEDLSNVKINVKYKGIFKKLNGTFNNLSILSLRYVVFSDINDPLGSILFSSRLSPFLGFRITNSEPTISIDYEHEATIPILPSGFRLAIYFTQNTAFLGGGNTSFELTEFNTKIQAKSTAIASVSKAVRLIDAINYSAKSICTDLSVVAPRFEIGGEWYDNFILSGNMLRGVNKFVIEWKQIHNYIQGSPNCDYEVNGEIVYIGNDEDFYTNTEIGAFLIVPNDDNNAIFNDRFTNNGFNFKYKDYNQDEDDSNTLDSVHTEIELSLANDQVNNSKDIDIEFIRDGSLGETTRKKAVSESDTSLSEDDKTFVYDIVPIAPSTKLEYTRRLSHNIDEDDNLQLLNDGSFNWSLLGFDVGAPFELKNTDNIGIYTVLELTNNIITLQGNASTAILSELTTFEYPLTNVAYTIRTNEGFDTVEGISAPNEYPNLYYTPKRDILNNWSHFLATCSLYNDLEIKTVYFKNAPEEGLNLRTALTDGELITENSDILQSELKDPLVTPELFTNTVLCSFLEWQELSEKIRTERGFIRVWDHNLRVRKLYIKDCEFSWMDNKLSIKEAEEKWEGDVTTIDFTNGVYYINEVGYDEQIVSETFFKAEDDYIQLFDSLTRPLINKTHYSLISVSGTIYENTVELATAIQELDD